MPASFTILVVPCSFFKELPDDLKKQLNLGYGLQVTGVSSGKMSDAGVRKGFIILKANDQPMRKVSDLEEVMKAAVKSPNQVLFLTGLFLLIAHQFDGRPSTD